MVNLEINSINAEAEGDINLSKCERVKTCIATYLSMNPRLTLQSVEDKTSVPYSTLRRIINLNGNPQPEAVIKIYQSLGYDQELYQYMNDFHPEIASVMAIKNSHNREYKYINDEDRQYFLDESNFLILSLAFTTSGTTEEEIRFELGERGIAKLHELVLKGLIHKNEKGKYLGKIEFLKLPFSDIKKRIEFALKYYRLDEAGSEKNWLSYQTESLNELGLKALKILHQKQFNERKELIFFNPVYLGNIKVYSATVSSTFVAFTESGALQ